MKGYAWNTKFFLVLLGIFAIPINVYPLRNWDEAWYAEIIKNMASGKYNILIPFWNGEYYFDKAPLYFWLSVPIVKVFGLGEWQVRLVSVVAAAISAYLVFLLGKKLFDTKVGVLATVIFVTFGQVYVRSTHGNLDALLIALFLGSFYLYLISERKKVFSLLVGILIGLGFLTKGWTLGLFPAFVMFIYSLIQEKRFLPRSYFLIGLGAILTSLWWYVLGTIVWGEKFVNWYLLTLAEGNFKNPLADLDLAYIKYFLRDLGVWTIPFLFAFVFSYRKISRELVFLGLAIVAFVFGVSFTHEKLDWHILPAYPFASLVIAFGAARFVDKFCPRCLAMFVLILLLAQVFIVYKIENIFPDRSRVGADLGRYARTLMQGTDTVVLDDHDFTSFLYYSNAGRVYVSSPDGGKPGEFWTLKYSDLHAFSQDRQVLLITPNEDIFLQFAGRGRLVGEWDGYKFLRI